jgi:hypothetical protein
MPVDLVKHIAHVDQPALFGRAAQGEGLDVKRTRRIWLEDDTHTDRLARLVGRRHGARAVDIVPRNIVVGLFAVIAARAAEHASAAARQRQGSSLLAPCGGFKNVRAQGVH